MGTLEKVKDDGEQINFEFNPEDLENVVAFDPATGETKPHKFDPNDVVSIFIVEKGKMLKLPKK